MKFRILFFLAFALSAAMISCSDDEARKGDPDLTHDGVQWNIASVTYTLLDQNTGGSAIGQTYKTGTKENAGTFYFVEGDAKGSFEMNIEGYNKEDAFNYTDADGSLTIITLQQSVGVTTNQNVLALSGNSTDTEKTLSGTIVKQSTSGQFVLTVEMSLVKK